jgi:hypothetical protein
VVAPFRVPRGLCARDVRLIDRFVLWRGGAHAIRFEQSGLEIRNVASERGERPWARQPQSRTKAPKMKGSN